MGTKAFRWIVWIALFLYLRMEMLHPIAGCSWQHVRAGGDANKCQIIRCFNVHMAVSLRMQKDYGKHRRTVKYVLRLSTVLVLTMQLRHIERQPCKGTRRITEHDQCAMAEKVDYA
jgi:hypothetical protein